MLTNSAKAEKTVQIFFDEGRTASIGTPLKKVKELRNIKRYRNRTALPLLLY